MTHWLIIKLCLKTTCISSGCDGDIILLQFQVVEYSIAFLLVVGLTHIGTQIILSVTYLFFFTAVQ